MKTKEYIDKYNLSKGWNSKYQSDFLSDITSELLAQLEINKANDNIKGFENSVRVIRQKWDAISNKTPFGIPDKLWSYFFATVISKLREELCSRQMEQRRFKAKERMERRRSYDDFLREQENALFEEARNNFYFNLTLKLISINSVPELEFNYLGLPINSSKEDIMKRYREMSLKCHPDKGGNKEDFIKLTECKNKCLAYAGR